MEKLEIEEIEILCVGIESGLATSTPDFIQKCIDMIGEPKEIGKISLVKRLKNIKAELLKEVKNND